MRVLKTTLLSIFVVTMFSCNHENPVADQEQLIVEKTQNINRKQNLLNTIAAKEWLKAIPDYVKISQLSIPGTHESAALHEGFPNTAKCQYLNIDEQLNIGVRYLDIRCRHMKNKFPIYHGISSQRQDFSDILKSCKKFLKENPSEFIFMSVKEEYKSENNSRAFYQTFQEYLKNEASTIFYLQDRIPALQEVRGKIVLIRRFSSPVELGIQARYGWKDNSTASIRNRNTQINIQDIYKVTDNNAKWKAIESLFNHSINNKNKNTIYLNNTSGYKPGLFGIPNIKTVSNDINDRLGKYLYDLKNKKLGIIGIDFIGDYRAKQIYTTQDY